MSLPEGSMFSEPTGTSHLYTFVCWDNLGYVSNKLFIRWRMAVPSPSWVGKSHLERERTSSPLHFYPDILYYIMLYYYIILYYIILYYIIYIYVLVPTHMHTQNYISSIYTYIYIYGSRPKTHARLLVSEWHLQIWMCVFCCSGERRESAA